MNSTATIQPRVALPEEELGDDQTDNHLGAGSTVANGANIDDQPDDEYESDMQQALAQSRKDAEDEAVQRAIDESLADDLATQRALEQSEQEAWERQVEANVAQHKARKAKVQPKRAEGLTEEDFLGDQADGDFGDED